MKRLLLIFLFICNSVWADGSAGLTYYTYQGTGASPSINPLTYPTVRSTGISASINYPTGAFGTNILGSGLIDRVIVHWVGYINIPTGGTYTFGASADDGVIVTVNGVRVIDSWVDSGNGFRTGTPITLAAGVVPIDVWYYENGGGQAIVFQWYVNNSWQVVPTTVFATDATYWSPPALCCGGSSASFSADPTNTSKINTFTGRATSDSQVYIEQIGNSNTLTIEQSGTKNNSVTLDSTGSFNDVAITQSGNSGTQANIVDLTLNGNSNNIDITQQSTGGTKGVFATVQDSNNSVNILQKDSGSHYLNLNLSGGNKTVDVTQQGSAGHMADINLSGAGTRSINLIQQGATQQFYSINSTCASNCQAISVTQGQ